RRLRRWLADIPSQIKPLVNQGVIGPLPVLPSDDQVEAKDHKGGRDNADNKAVPSQFQPHATAGPFLQRPVSRLPSRPLPMAADTAKEPRALGIEGNDSRSAHSAIGDPAHASRALCERYPSERAAYAAWVPGRPGHLSRGVLPNGSCRMLTTFQP